jgi:hypothetical protein
MCWRRHIKNFKFCRCAGLRDCAQAATRLPCTGLRHDSMGRLCRVPIRKTRQGSAACFSHRCDGKSDHMVISSGLCRVYQENTHDRSLLVVCILLIYMAKALVLYFLLVVCLTFVSKAQCIYFLDIYPCTYTLVHTSTYIVLI